jgi:hypothetical protein
MPISSAKLQFKNKPSFSGHETFFCRNLWLKKGFDFLRAGKSFLDPEALHSLGVGKNMVTSIRFWMRAFGFTEDDQLTPLAYALFNDLKSIPENELTLKHCAKGHDPYCEDLGTLWLLHWKLVTTERATIFSLLFNDLRREKVEFTQSNFVYFATRLAELMGLKLSNNSLISDFAVALRIYIPGMIGGKEPEDGFTGLLTELRLIRKLGRINAENTKDSYFNIENSEKPTLPSDIVLFAILEQLTEQNVDDTGSQSLGGQSISFDQMLTERNSPGAVFALSPQGLYDKLLSISRHPVYAKYVVFSDQAGVKELQIKKTLLPLEVLDNYYLSSQ